MLTKLTAKNQITIPQEIMDRLPKVEYFDVLLREGVIELCPVLIAGESGIEALRGKMQQLGLSEASVVEAVDWARKNS